jgi:hypothetical protein
MTVGLVRVFGYITKIKSPSGMMFAFPKKLLSQLDPMILEKTWRSSLDP